MNAAAAWAAGFFEGEGSTSLAKARTSRGWNEKPYAMMQLTQVDIEPLLRFVGVVRDGSIRQRKRPPHQDQWVWQASGDPSVRRIANILWDGLSTRRKRRICEVLVGDDNA